MNLLRFIYLIIITLLLVATCKSQATENAKRVVMIVSSHGQQQGEQAPGFEYDELSKAYLVFKRNGLRIDIASPSGGNVEADQYDPSTPYNQLLAKDLAFAKKLANTLPIDQLNAKDYSGIFIVGGKGAMFDLPDNTALQQLIADIYQQQGSVAAVCHGPAALVNVKLDNGSYLVANKVVNSFTNVEEQFFGQKWLPYFDFMLEDKLVERGGQFQSSPMMLSHVAIDERLITGQNPASTVDVASAQVAAMGVELMPFTPFKDDKTLAAIAEVLKGNQYIKNELDTADDNYNIELVGMYGYLYVNVAKDTETLQNALTLMLLAKTALNKPKLEVKIAEVQQQLGQNQNAANTLEHLLVRHPDFEPAQKMLEALTKS